MRAVERVPESRLPAERLRVANDRGVRRDGGFVLYWMTAARRARWSFALDRAVEISRALGRPLIVLEALRVDYPWASDRHHRFVLDGMADNARAFAGGGVLYYPYVERSRGEGKGLLAALGAHACTVVTDDHPGRLYPRMIAAAARRLPVRLEAIDGCGLMPLAATPGPFARAYDFRRFLQRALRPHLDAMPRRDPLRAAALQPRRRLPPGIARRWPRASAALLAGTRGALARLPIDHAVAPVPYRGGSRAARAALARFVAGGLDRYGERRRHPDEGGGSGLSPYLHFGHISSHEVLAGLAVREGWSPGDVAEGGRGQRRGFWGMSGAAEAFLDQLVTWRELGFVHAFHRPDLRRFESLPAWARATLEAHAGDPRPYRYDLGTFARAATHDDLWNAAQRQLWAEGRIHGYLRMLWGKKILHYSESPRAALDIMLALNDTYAVDGRDPNSDSGIFWVLGRYDRPWGPERPVFGKVRYMSSAQAWRKLRVGAYVARWLGRPGRRPGPAEG